MSCKCKNKINSYVDISRIDPEPWDDVPVLVGLKECGDIVPVDKPEFEFTEEDQQKVDTIVNNGDGNSALFNNGNYKKVYSASDIDDLIKDDVVYDEEDDIRPRKNIVLDNDYKLLGTDLEGEDHNLIELNRWGIVDVGNSAHPCNINTDGTKPTVQYQGETGSESHKIAFETDIILHDIALSDQILTNDAAGLKANISVVVNGNNVRVLGKLDNAGEAYILGEFNVLQSQIIDEVYVEDGFLYITFIVDGDPGTETVKIDLSTFIDVYIGSRFINVEDNTISLNFEELHDELINDGFAKGDDFVKKSGDTLVGPLNTQALIPSETEKYDIGSTSKQYNVICCSTLISNSVVRPLSDGVGRLGNNALRYHAVHANNYFVGSANKTSEITALTVNGTGSNFLADDGTYKPISTALSEYLSTYEGKALIRSLID